MLTGRVPMPIGERITAATITCAVVNAVVSMEHPDPCRFQLAQIAEQYGPIATAWIWMFPHSSKTAERLKKIPGFRKPEMECAFFAHMKQWKSHQKCDFYCFM